MSRSSTQLMQFAEPAAKIPPTSVAATTPRPGTPSAARNITGTVVISSSSMILGLVSATYAETTCRTDGRGAVRAAVVTAGRGSTAVTNTSIDREDTGVPRH
jgi:hypothetical protein